jgi:D-alanyl-D-alanine carboxypeptidase
MLALQFNYSERKIKMKQDILDQKVSSIKNPYSNFSPVAKSALVYIPSKDQVLYMHHHNKVLPLASITKLMTAVVAQAFLSPDEPVTITKDALDTEGEYGLTLNEKWESSELIKLMLVVSSNDGAEALKNAVEEKNNIDFVKEMNNASSVIGLKTMYFTNATGLDEKDDNDRKPTAQGSCKDASKLLYVLYRDNKDLLNETQYRASNFTSIDGVNHIVENTDILTMDPTLNIVAGKTGMTTMAGGNLVVLSFVGLPEPVAFCVLGSTTEDRFYDIRELIQRTKTLVYDVNSLGLDISVLNN